MECTFVSVRIVDTEKEIYQKLGKYKMCFWRRMEKISWAENVSHEEVLGRIGGKRALISAIYNK